MNPTTSEPHPPADPSASPARFPWLNLIVLAAAVFLSVTSELLPAGLLPDMSTSLGVPQPQVGLLVTIFAGTVVASSAPLATVTRRWSRHRIMVVILLTLALSNLLTAVVPTYGLVVATRVIGGLAHGLFWAVVGAYAGYLVPKAQIAKAVAITLGGGTVAIVIGVPVGTWLGHLFGWRLAFGLVGLAMVVVSVLLWRFLPDIERLRGDMRLDAVRRAEAALATAAAPATTGSIAIVTGSARRRRTLRRPRGRDTTVVPVLVVCVITAVIMTGQNTLYTYVVPFMIHRMGVAPGQVGALLFVYGIAGAGGLLVAGLFGKRPTTGLVTVLVAVGTAVTVLAVWAELPYLAIPALFLWGAGFGALPPLLQTRMLHTSSESFRDTASALYTTGFNVGIGGGALLGAVIYAVADVTDLAWVFVGILALSLVVIVAAFARDSG